MRTKGQPPNLQRRRPIGQATVLFLAASFVLCGTTAAQLPLPYDIVYVRAPRAGDNAFVELPEVLHPVSFAAGADLMLLHPDGSEEILVPSDGKSSYADPMISFDSLWCYYVKFHDQTNLQTQRPGDPSRDGADIFKINLQTREIVQLTFQEWTPNTGVLNWSNNHVTAQPSGTWYLGYGVFNLGPCPLPGGKIVFSSSRNNYFPNKTFTNPNFQLFVMDNDGSNVECIGHLNLGSALHPTVLTDGRIMFSSYEAQGIRDQRLWGLWAIWPDGTRWEPLLSPFTKQNAFHFQTQLSNGDIAVADYYNQNNKGFGTILAFPATKNPLIPPFGSPAPSGAGNPAVRRGIWWFTPSHPNHMQPRYRKYSFSPQGLYALSAFSHSDDNASSFNLSGTYAGKVTHPAAAPGNGLLMTYSPGPANSLNRPTKYPAYDGGIVLLDGGVPVTDEADLLYIKNDPAYNEIQPRPVVTYQDIYGIPEPAYLPWNTNDGSAHSTLEPGTPFGLVGTSSFYKRDTDPADNTPGWNGFDAFNTNQNQNDSNWSWQGAAAGRYTSSEIHAVRILAMEPSSNVGYGPGIGNNWIRGFKNHATERLRILGEIPLKKDDGAGGLIMDPEGNPDTSFLARIPADVAFTFQTLDEDGLVLNMSQTWHQVRPGELRNDCGGCHAHSQMPLDFNQTAAAGPGYTIRDLALTTPLLSKDGTGAPIVVDHPERAVDVEFYRDIKPILDRSCVGCHNAATPSGNLRLDDNTGGNYTNVYTRLADDSGANWGYPPLISTGSWRNNNASRYIRKFQSRRSMLIWKIFGRRLDGWSNSDHPSETFPGSGVLPPGTNPNDTDIDYTGDMMPPPTADPVLYPPLTEDEKIMFARWVDLGSPATSQGGGVQQHLGWFADEVRPTIDVSLPYRGRSLAPLNLIRIGAFDYYSGLDLATLSITADVAINGQPPGTELAPFFAQSGDHVWTLPVSPPVTSLDWSTLTVSILDNTGNLHTVERTFSIGPPTIPPLMTGVQMTPGGEIQMTLQSEPQQQQLIEVSDDLDHWFPFMTILDFDGQQTIADPAAAGFPRGYYRARPLPLGP